MRIFIKTIAVIVVITLITSNVVAQPTEDQTRRGNIFQTAKEKLSVFKKKWNENQRRLAICRGKATAQRIGFKDRAEFVHECSRNIREND